MTRCPLLLPLLCLATLAGCAPSTMTVKLDADVKTLLATMPTDLVRPVGGFGDSEPAAGGGGSFAGDLDGSDLTDSSDDTVTVDDDLVVTGTILANPGTLALPGYAFSGNTGAGMYEVSGTLGFSTAGSLRFYLNPGGRATFTTTLEGQGLATYGFGRQVQAVTHVAASPLGLNNSSDVHKVFTNEGATAETHITLNTAVAGKTFAFFVQDADGLQINAGAGDTIRIGGSVSATAGFISSTTVGDFVTLVAINSTEWVAISVTDGHGWTFDT